jgi:hypothetical protein
VSSQFDAPASLFPWKESPVLIGLVKGVNVKVFPVPKPTLFPWKESPVLIELVNGKGEVCPYG